MNDTPKNLPDEIWNRLKEWARARAASPCADDTPGSDDYHARVADIVKEVTGRRDGVPADVAAFYARETAEMVMIFRAEPTLRSDSMVIAPQPE